MRIYIGIDPGAKGFVCVCCGGVYTHIPLRESPKSKGINPAVLKELRGISERGDCVCCIESVHAMPGQGVSSTFTFGQNFGMILGVVSANSIPYELVSPNKWQKEMVTAADKCESTKQSSYNAARRLHPDMDFRRSVRARNFDDNKVDATLICDYAIRKNL